MPSITKIPLTQGLFAIVDEVDSDLVENKWRAGSANSPYAVREIWNHGDRYTEHMHRVIIERVLGRKLLPDEVVDHINRIVNDNRRCNLRAVGQEINMRNQEFKAYKKRKKYLGVHHDTRKLKPWYVKIRCFNKTINVTYLSTAEEAAYIHDQIIIQLGDYHPAALNLL